MSLESIAKIGGKYDLQEGDLIFTPIGCGLYFFLARHGVIRNVCDQDRFWWWKSKFRNLVARKVV